MSDKSDIENDAHQTVGPRESAANHEQLLDRLGSVAQTFGAARDLRTVYRALYEFALATTPCISIGISLVDRAMRRPVFACCGDKEIDVSDVPPVKIAGESPHTTALRTNQVVILDDLQAAMANRKLVPIGFEYDPTVPRSSLIAPMSVMGRVVGSFEIQASRPAAFNHEHATAMRMAANLAAVAIENVRLFDREREREEELRLSQKMEAVGRLAGGVAHDFNNLLTAIIGYSQLIAARLRRDDPLYVEIKEIEKAGNRAAALTRQLLAFSRKQVLLPKVLDLNAVIADMQKLLGRLIGEDIELSTVLEPGLGRVMADPGQLEQVLMNLAVNARDAMPRGGKLEIQTANVQLDLLHDRVGSTSLKPGRYVRITISDSGEGMDEETISHIFEPFFTTKELGKGTGLGLSTVYGIISQSEGDISCESQRDVGTTFTIYLPRVDSPADVEQATDFHAEISPVSETILLVEDEQAVRRLVEEILRSSGYLVLQAANGADAIKICGTHDGEIQLMITDVVMPQMSGRELAERAAALRPRMKVLYMSGYTDDSIVRHGLAEKEISFLQKPFSPNSLLAAVRSILDRQVAANDNRAHGSVGSDSDVGTDDQTKQAEPYDLIN